MIDSTCGGRGICGRCRVIAGGELSPPDAAEVEHFAGRPEDLRLACRAKVLGDVSVNVSDAWTKLECALGPQFRDVPLDSPLKRTALPRPGEGAIPYADTIPLKISDPRVLAKIASWDGNRESFGVAFLDELMDVEFDRSRVLGAAVDIGTTTLSLNLFDLETGEFLNRSSAINPQTAYGGDVITRIAYCRENAEGVSVLQAALIAQVESMLDEVLAKVAESRSHVRLVTAAGNTTMLHILAGVNPLTLALAPFRPIFLRPLVIEAERCGLHIAQQGRLALLPGASAYVGADIVAGLTAIDYRSCSGCTLFVDIGTNGEMVLLERTGRLLATSCAMGPALEGMNISCGCRAVQGAIDSVTLCGDMTPRFTTIGGAPPTGLCGSGLVDLVAALVCTGVIDPNGAFSHKISATSTGRLRGDRYYLTEHVFLSQKDVRQVQLAKSAAITGILTLLSEAGLSVADLERIIVGGSFGYHLDPENLKHIGLLPAEYMGRINMVGNSSLCGASLALISHQIMKEMEELASAIRVVELGSHPDFSREFISHLKFMPDCTQD